MKKVLLIFALSFISLFSYSKNGKEGIIFFKGTWNELLSEAKKQNKPIFIDVYTDWCRPCKVLEKDIFPNDKVGDFYNKNFINYRFDAEKGEGIAFAKKYDIVSYPTLLYLNKESKILFTKAGSQTTLELIDTGKKVLESVTNFKELTYYSKNYELNKYDSDFVLAYTRKLSENNLSTQSVLDTYLSKIPDKDWSKIEVLQIIGSSFSSLDSKAYEVLRSNFEVLVLSREQEKSSAALGNIVQVQRLEKKRSIQIQDEDLLDKALNLQYLIFGGWSVKGREELDLEIFPSIKTQTKLDFYFKGKKWLKYHELCKSYVNQANLIKTNPILLNTYAREHFENIEDKEMLQDALQWIEDIVKIEPKSEYCHTYACLLYKLDRKEEAIKIEEEAIAKEKVNDTKEFEQTLAKMKDGTFLKK